MECIWKTKEYRYCCKYGRGKKHFWRELLLPFRYINLVIEHLISISIDYSFIIGFLETALLVSLVKILFHENN